MSKKDENMEKERESSTNHSKMDPMRQAALDSSLYGNASFR